MTTLGAKTKSDRLPSELNIATLSGGQYKIHYKLLSGIFYFLLVLQLYK